MLRILKCVYCTRLVPFRNRFPEAAGLLFIVQSRIPAKESGSSPAAQLVNQPFPGRDHSNDARWGFDRLFGIHRYDNRFVDSVFEHARRKG